MRRLILGLAAAVLALGSLAAAASADPPNGKGWKKHGRHGYGGPVIVYGGSLAYYPPPQVYYPPPQVYYPPPQVYYPPPVVAYPYAPSRGGVSVQLSIPFGR